MRLLCGSQEMVLTVVILLWIRSFSCVTGIDRRACHGMVLSALGNRDKMMMAAERLM